MTITLAIREINQTSFLIVMLNLISEVMVFYNFYNFNWVRIDMNQVFATFFFYDVTTT